MKMLSKLCTLLMAVALMMSLSTSALAAGTVTYDGDADKFVFAPGTEESLTNLFDEFQEVMPGDSLTQQVLFKNDTSRGVKVQVYMRALGAQEDSDGFLSELELTVTKQDDTVLFDAAANETAQLTDWVYLGTLYSGGEILLDVTLDVPITMGNDFQDQAGYLDWQFKIEEFPIEPSDPKPPKTGDTGEIFLYCGLLAVSVLGLTAVLRSAKRKSQ